MPHDSYPTEDMLAKTLSTAKVSVADPDLLTHHLLASIAAFEKQTGRTMLAPATPATRLFTPPRNGRSLVLYDDLARLDSVVVQTAGSGASTLAAGGDFYAQPDNALARGKPITALEFSLYGPGLLGRLGWDWDLSQRGSVQVTGLWGYSARVPDDVWVAILSGAALSVGGVPLTGTVAGSPFLSKWTAPDGATEEYAVTAWRKALVDGWAAQFTSTADNYRRMTA